MDLRIVVLIGLLVCHTGKLNAYDAPHADSAPVVDGIPDDPAWAAAAWKAMDKLILGSMPEPADFSGRFKVVWTSSRLYLLAEIIDDTLHDSHPDPLVRYWDDDTLEVFIDEDRSGGDHLYNYNAFAYHIALDNQAVDIGPFLTEADRKAGKLNVRTYPHHIKSRWQRSLEAPEKIYWEVEIAVYSDKYRDTYPEGMQPAKPVVLRNGKELGFMVAYCDSDNGDEREHFMGDVDIAPVNGDKNRGYIDAGVFGLLRLVPAAD